MATYGGGDQHGNGLPIVDSDDEIEEIVLDEDKDYTCDEVKQMLGNLDKIKHRLKQNKQMAKQKQIEIETLNEEKSHYEIEFQNRLEKEVQQNEELKQMANKEYKLRVQLEQEINQMESSPAQFRPKPIKQPIFDINGSIQNGVYKRKLNTSPTDSLILEDHLSSNWMQKAHVKMLRQNKLGNYNYPEVEIKESREEQALSLQQLKPRDQLVDDKQYSNSVHSFKPTSLNAAFLPSNTSVHQLNESLTKMEQQKQMLQKQLKKEQIEQLKKATQEVEQEQLKKDQQLNQQQYEELLEAIEQIAQSDMLGDYLDPEYLKRFNPSQVALLQQHYAKAREVRRLNKNYETNRKPSKYSSSEDSPQEPEIDKYTPQSNKKPQMFGFDEQKPKSKQPNDLKNETNIDENENSTYEEGTGSKQIDQMMQMLKRNERNKDKKKRIDLNFSHMNVEKYNGAEGTLEAFLDDMNECAKNNEWDQSQILAAARTRLSGLAKEYKNRNRKLRNTTSWREFCDLMKRRFETQTNEASVMNQLLTCVQRKGERVSEYIMRMEDLIQKLCPDDTNEEKRAAEKMAVNTLIRNIKEKYRHAIVSKSPKNWDEAVQHALKEEEIENTVGYAKYVTNPIIRRKHYMMTDSSDSESDFGTDYDTEDEEIKENKRKNKKANTKEILEEIKKSLQSLPTKASNDTSPMVINALPQNNYNQENATEYQQESVSQSRQQIPLRQPFSQQNMNTNYSNEPNPTYNSQNRFVPNQNERFNNQYSREYRPTRPGFSNSYNTNYTPNYQNQNPNYRPNYSNQNYNRNPASWDRTRANEQGYNSGNSTDPDICFNCHKRGHQRRDCLACEYCKIFGHRVDTCRRRILGMPPLRYAYNRNLNRPTVINSYTGTVPYTPNDRGLRPYPNINNEPNGPNSIMTTDQLINQANEIKNRQFRMANPQQQPQQPTKTVSFGPTTTLNEDNQKPFSNQPSNLNNPQLMINAVIDKQQEYSIPVFLCEINNQPIKAMIDTCSSFNLISCEYANLLKLGKSKTEAIQLESITGTDVEIDRSYTLTVIIGGQEFKNTKVYTTKGNWGLSLPLVLGIPFIRENQLAYSGKDNSLIYQDIKILPNGETRGINAAMKLNGCVAVASQKYTLPPRTGHLINVELDIPMTTTLKLEEEGEYDVCLIPNNELLNENIIAPYVVNRIQNGQCLYSLENISNTEINIYPRQRVAKVKFLRKAQQQQIIPNPLVVNPCVVRYKDSTSKDPEIELIPEPEFQTGTEINIDFETENLYHNVVIEERPYFSNYSKMIKTSPKIQRLKLEEIKLVSSDQNEAKNNIQMRMSIEKPESNKQMEIVTNLTNEQENSLKSEENIQDKKRQSDLECCPINKPYLFLEEILDRETFYNTDNPLILIRTLVKEVEFEMVIVYQVTTTSIINLHIFKLAAKAIDFTLNSHYNVPNALQFNFKFDHGRIMTDCPKEQIQVIWRKEVPDQILIVAYDDTTKIQLEYFCATYERMVTYEDTIAERRTLDDYVTAYYQGFLNRYGPKSLKWQHESDAEMIYTLEDNRKTNIGKPIIQYNPIENVVALSRHIILLNFDKVELKSTQKAPVWAKGAVYKIPKVIIEWGKSCLVK